MTGTLNRAVSYAADMADLIMRPIDFHTIAIPIPYASGTINVYFSEKPIPTLIDIPPNEACYCEQLESALGRKGCSLVKDIKRIIITHPHFDHCGLANWIVKHCKAEIWVFRGSGAYLENFPEETLEDFKYYSSLLEQAGVPGQGSEYLEEFSQTLLRLGSRAPVSRYLEEGDEIEFGSAVFRVIHVPGHTPWCIMMYDAERQMAFTGDFLIKDISSNAVVQRPGTVADGYKSLKSYITSLKKAQNLGLEQALPGHGGPVMDVQGWTQDILSFIGNRKSQILSIVTKRPACSPYQIMKDLFPDLGDWQILLGISEVMGHLELLEEDGTIVREGEKRLLFSRCS